MDCIISSTDSCTLILIIADFKFSKFFMSFYNTIKSIHNAHKVEKSNLRRGKSNLSHPHSVTVTVIRSGEETKML